MYIQFCERILISSCEVVQRHCRTVGTKGNNEWRREIEIHVKESDFRTCQGRKINDNLKHSLERSSVPRAIPYCSWQKGIEIEKKESNENRVELYMHTVRKVFFLLKSNDFKVFRKHNSLEISSDWKLKIF